MPYHSVFDFNRDKDAKRLIKRLNMHKNELFTFWNTPVTARTTITQNSK